MIYTRPTSGNNGRICGRC